MTAPPFRLYRLAKCAGCGQALPKDSLAVAREHHVYCSADCADARTDQRELKP